MRTVWSERRAHGMAGRSKLRVLLLVGCLVGSSGVWASESDGLALKQEVETLRAMVLDMRDRISRLEKQLQPEVRVVPTPQADVPILAAQPGASATYVSPDALLRVNWSKIVPTLDQSGVMKILGEPSKKFMLDGRTVWLYRYPSIGTGSVFFTDAGRVSSSQSPFGS